MELEDLKGVYFPTESDLDRELFLPVARHATSIHCMTGYFSSSVLRVLAKSLSVFLASRSDDLKFIISPNLPEQDVAAIEEAIEADQSLIPLLFPGFEISEETLVNKTVQALSYLIATKGLEIRIAFKKQGMFHSKCWICETSKGALTIHGSVNATSAGITQNFEQIAVNRAWESEESAYVVDRFKAIFQQIWDNSYPELTTMGLNNKTIAILKEMASDSEANADTIKMLLQEVLDVDNPASDPPTKLRQLKVPHWLNYSTGTFAHQGKAIKAWFDNGGKGILSIATGGGKTLTALVAASLIQAKEESLLIVIAVPTVALLDQWAEDVKIFDVEPINSRHIAANDFGRQINSALRSLRLSRSKSEVVLLTHDSLKSDKVKRLLSKAAAQTKLMLIGDEAHNLGSIGFQDNALEIFKYTLGLSATFKRKFDETGTQFLLDYFGRVVFEFGLKEAIGTCLVPFEYFVFEVSLDSEEEEEWGELTQQIRKLSYASELPDGDSTKDRWKLLCLKRRRVVEGAKLKISALAKTLPSNNDSIRRTLIFCTDKQPNQLKSVNRLLTKREINFHQVTAEETSDKAKLADIVRSFDNGALKILTSKRVLDEGFNIPQTETAYLMASNTVERQWVQRLGRILRKCPSTGKTKATVHDFIAMPAIVDGSIDSDLRSLIKGELERVQFFGDLSSNGLEPGGSLKVISKLLKLMEAK